MSIRRKFLHTCLWGLLSSAGLSSAAELPPPLPKPDCSTLPPYMAKIAAQWPKPAERIRGIDRPEGDAPVPFGKKLILTLMPWERVKLAMQPSEQGKVDFFAGIFTLHPTKSGVYRFVTTPYVWIELVNADVPGPQLRMVFSDKRLYCAGIDKDVAFELEAGVRYWFQVSGTKAGPEVEAMVFPPD